MTRLLSSILENIGDWWYIIVRQLHLVKCDQHGWTYILDDTESDRIQCPFCGSCVWEGDRGFEDLKRNIIMWRFNEFCRTAPWTQDLEEDLTCIVDRNK